VPLRSETAKNALMFSTTADSGIDETDPSPFPAGCVFLSSVADNLYDVTVKRACPGRLVSFAGGASEGTPLRRVRSRGALARVISGGDLRLIKTCAPPTPDAVPRLS
jgi:hypothetical protein